MLGFKNYAMKYELDEMILIFHAFFELQQHALKSFMFLQQHDTDEAKFDKFTCNKYCDSTADKNILGETGTLFS